jgi:hypothetical protein
VDPQVISPNGDTPRGPPKGFPHGVPQVVPPLVPPRGFPMGFPQGWRHKGVPPRRSYNGVTQRWSPKLLQKWDPQMRFPKFGQAIGSHKGCPPRAISLSVPAKSNLPSVPPNEFPQRWSLMRVPLCGTTWGSDYCVYPRECPPGVVLRDCLPAISLSCVHPTWCHLVRPPVGFPQGGSPMWSPQRGSPRRFPYVGSPGGVPTIGVPQCVFHWGLPN